MGAASQQATKITGLVQSALAGIYAAALYHYAITDDRYGARVHDELRLRHRLHDTGLQPSEVPSGSQDAVRLMTPEIRLHERVGKQGGIRERHPRTLVDIRYEAPQRLVLCEDRHARVSPA
jgi:hypothetical protein